MGKHDYTKMDRARDELMSHVIRCDVFEAEMDHRTDWLNETMDYMAERYPMLSDLQLTQLEIIGRQFIKPPIPHGKGHTARTRDRDIDELVEAETADAPHDVEAADVEAEVETPEVDAESENEAELQAA